MSKCTEYEFWMHLPELGCHEFRITVPGKNEKEARKNFKNFIKMIRKKQVRTG